MREGEKRAENRVRPVTARCAQRGNANDCMALYMANIQFSIRCKLFHEKKARGKNKYKLYVNKCVYFI